METKPKIYLAGPDVFRRDATEFFDGLKALADKHGFEGLSPLDNEATDALEIYRANLQMIQYCDYVVANIEPFRGPSVDPGTAFEIGYARALGKTIIMYTNTADKLKYRSVGCAGGTYPIIEDFGLPENLMIACSGPVLMSLEAALLWLKTLRQGW